MGPGTRPERKNKGKEAKKAETEVLFATVAILQYY
jgi:hypothetical protein